VCTLEKVFMNIANIVCTFEKVFMNIANMWLYVHQIKPTYHTR
jgi:hypothetical protein